MSSYAARSAVEQREAAREGERRERAEIPAPPKIRPVPTNDRSRNPLRPTTFDELIGQETAKALLRRVVEASKLQLEPLDHVLLVGPSGTGKSTFGTVIANELGSACYQIAAPLSFDTLLDLRETMRDGDILFVDEIHMQAIQERRGRESITKPEVFYNVLEDRTLVTPEGVLPFPQITVIGATTDEGMLPDPFLNRFPLRPRLEPYTDPDLGEMAWWNAQALGVPITVGACVVFAEAARGTPRILNNYVKNATSLTRTEIDQDIAIEVVTQLNGTTLDGLDRDQQAMLTFLYQRGRRETASGEVRYQASVNTIATGIGKSRDTKAVALRVEPYLIQRGYVQVGHGGRLLTDDGVYRAQELLGEA